LSLNYFSFFVVGLWSFVPHYEFQSRETEQNEIDRFHHPVHGGCRQRNIVHEDQRERAEPSCCISLPEEPPVQLVHIPTVPLYLFCSIVFGVRFLRSGLGFGCFLKSPGREVFVTRR
jgi:hypothetical protein